MAITNRTIPDQLRALADRLDAHYQSETIKIMNWVMRYGTNGIDEFSFQFLAVRDDPSQPPQGVEGEK